MTFSASVVRSIFIATAAVIAWTSPILAKESYAPDARAQKRAFSRAVTTAGGKIVWLGGQTGSPNSNFDGQVREIFAELDKRRSAAAA